MSPNVSYFLVTLAGIIAGFYAGLRAHVEPLVRHDGDDFSRGYASGRYFACCHLINKARIIGSGPARDALEEAAALLLDIPREDATYERFVQIQWRLDPHREKSAAE